MNFTEILDSLVDKDGGLQMTFNINFSQKTIIDLSAAAFGVGMALMLGGKLVNNILK